MFLAYLSSCGLYVYIIFIFGCFVKVFDAMEVLFSRLTLNVDTSDTTVLV